MAISKRDKLVIQQALKNINVKSLYSSVDEDKRKWFRFGAYDMLRVISELIDEYPEPKTRTKSVGIRIANPDEK